MIFFLVGRTSIFLGAGTNWEEGRFGGEIKNVTEEVQKIDIQ